MRGFKVWFRVTLEARDDAALPPVRLRMLLKTRLRRDGVRCRKVEQMSVGGEWVG